MLKSLLLLSLLTPALTWSKSCEQQQVKLQVLGSGGPEIDDGRVSSSHLLWVNGKARILVDAGSGSAHQFGQSQAKFSDLDAILLTHLHVDHSADLPAFIKASFFTDRKQDLYILGPKGNQLMPDTTAFVEQLFGSEGAFAYLSNYLLPESNSPYKIQAINASLDHRTIQSHKPDDDITVHSIGVNHGPISAVAWRIDVGDCSVTFSGDMSNQFDALKLLAKDTDLLVANNAIEEGATGVARKLHMPPSVIGQIATAAQAKKLLLAHFMKRSNGVIPQTIETIRKTYQGPLLLADDLLTITWYDKDSSE